MENIPKVGNCQAASPVIELNSEQSIPPISALRSSDYKRIQKNFVGDNKSKEDRKSIKRANDQSMNTSGKKVKLQSVVNDDDDDSSDNRKMEHQIVTLELPCTEPSCDQILQSRSSLRKHIWSEHHKSLYHQLTNNVRLNDLNQTEHFCTNCTLVSKSMKCLKEHWKYYHQPSKYQCRVCPFVANLYYKVVNHLNNTHGSHECTYGDCDKVFTRMSHLMYHQLVHTGEKPYECRYEGCGLRFKSLGVASRHVRSVHFKPPESAKE